MKKFLSLLLAMALLCATLLTFSSCGRRISYEESEKYSAGAFETDEKITAIEIYWDGNYVSVGGAYTANTTVEEDYFKEDARALRYLVEDGVLKIYPCESGKGLGKTNKSLFVTLPMDVATGLKSVKITAADETKVVLQMLKVDNLTVSSEDGNVRCDGTYKEVSVKTEKGSLTLTSPEITNLNFTSDIGSANLSLHMQGFMAVMQNEKGTFDTTYEISEDSGIYTYGTQDSLLTFNTAGIVHLEDVSITG